MAVPNFEIMVDLYLNLGVSLNNILGPLYGEMPMGEETIYHRTTYDFDVLYDLLESLGLKDIHRYNWRKTSHAEFDDHSQAYIPHMDKESGTLISLNVEAIK